MIKNDLINGIINVSLEYSKLLPLQQTCILTSDKENILQLVESQAHLRIFIVHIIQRYYSNTANLNLSQFYKHMIFVQSCLNLKRWLSFLHDSPYCGSMV